MSLIRVQVDPREIVSTSEQGPDVAIELNIGRRPIRRRGFAVDIFHDVVQGRRGVDTGGKLGRANQYVCLVPRRDPRGRCILVAGTEMQDVAHTTPGPFPSPSCLYPNHPYPNRPRPTHPHPNYP